MPRTVLLSIMLLILPLKSFAEVEALPLTADHCAIQRALTGTANAACPEIADLGATRGLPRMAGVAKPSEPIAGRGYFIHFEFDSDDLNEEYRQHLSRLADVLKSDGMNTLCLMLVGHTDAVGPAGYNLSLSHSRARSVMLFLAGPLQIATNRMATGGKGESSLLPGVAANDAKNRRVEILAKDVGGICDA